jgi:WD40 repeat protein
MAKLQQFRENVTIYRKRQDDPATGRPYTLDALAKAIGLSADELGHRLRGTGRSLLTKENVLAIVRTLAQWETLTWDEAVRLLTLMDYPFDSQDWQTELQRFLVPPPQSFHHASRTSADSLRENPAVPVRRRLFQARELPKEYVPRPKVFNEIKCLLLTYEENQTTPITTALRGAGGFGKTTLALALCHDPDVQAAFPDGILWVELGENPPGPFNVLNEMLHVLEPSVGEAITLEEARKRWRKALEKRACLLVIDDVWRTEALEELLKGGSRCGRLITTRNDQLLPEETKRVWVDTMEPEEAMALLCQGLVEDWHRTLERPILEQVVIQQLGCWPLLVSLARGMLTNQVRRLKKTPGQALVLIKQAYEDRGMAAFHLGDRIERQRTVHACLEVNLRQLEDWMPPHYQARQRYQEMAVFPDGTDIPLATLQTYWQGTGGLQAWEVEDLCLHLSDLSLVLPWNPEQGTVRLHDVMRSYLIQRAGPHLPALHGHLLDSYQLMLRLTRWADLPQSEEYLWQHLVFHICQAGHQDALQSTLTDLCYLTRKALYMGVSALETDLLHASTVLSLGTAESAPFLFVSLYRRMVRISYLLRQAKTEAEIGGLLLSHFGWEEAFAPQRFSLEHDLPHPFLTAWYPLPQGSSPALLRILSGHTRAVFGCVVSPDGKWIVSASHDCTLKVWDAATGTEHLTLTGHTQSVNGCAVSPDGCFIVSASSDKTLKVWDMATGAEQLTLTGHGGEVNDCAVSPDGRWIVSASDDQTLKIWDMVTGAEQLTLTGHTDSVNDCVMSPDGKWIVSASHDCTLKVWDAVTGTERQTLSGHRNRIFGCAVSPDGRWIVSASLDQTLKIWDMVDGTEQLTLSDPTSDIWSHWQSHPISDCAVSPDGSFIVSASDDQTLKVWDMFTRTKQLTISNSVGEITRCAMSPDGRFCVSVANDRTIKVWDMATGTEQLTISDSTDNSWRSLEFIRICDCAVSPDGRRIVSTAGHQTLKVWDATTGAKCLTLSGHMREVYGCAVSPDGGFIVSASGDQTLKVWDAATGAERLTLSGHTREVIGCTVSPDSRFIVSASGDQTLKVWDAATGVEQLILVGHTNSVNGCAVSPDSRFIVSASSDKTLKVWDVRTEQCLLTFPMDGALHGCAFHPDGEHLIACGVWGMRFLRLLK